MAGLLVAFAVVPGQGEAQTLRGLLVERETQIPIELGRITLLTEDRDSVAAVLTDEQGYFSVSAPDPGLYRLVGSALGYRGSMIGPFELEEGDVRVVEVQVGVLPVALPGLMVAPERLAEPEVATLVATGFYDRLAEGRGEFLTPGEIAASPVRHTPQLFREMTTVRLLPALGDGANGPWNDRVLISPNPTMDPGAGATPEERRRRSDAIERSRNPRYESMLCAPRVFRDGVLLERNPGESLADAVPKSEIEAVEVFRAPFGAPAEYQGTSNCGVVLIWTVRR